MMVCLAFSKTYANDIESLLVINDRDILLGNPKSPVTLIEYGDYQCPFCAKMFAETEPQLRKEYINTGKVKMIYRNLQFLGAESISASIAAECAKDQGKFWPYRDALFQAKISDLKNSGGENDGFFNSKLFIQLASNIGLNVKTFSMCYNSNKYMNIIKNETDYARAMGVEVTPTVFINKEKVVGAQPYSVFKSLIDIELNKCQHEILRYCNCF